MTEARAHASQLHQEANRLLKETNLEGLLTQYGAVDLGGSFAYDLLVDRDLDFGVTVKDMTPQIRSEIAALFTLQSWCYGIHMVDRINFKPLSNLGAPLGLYLGLTIPFPNNRWNIDVWFMVGDTLPISDITELIENATAEQKETILQIKYELMQSGQKEKGVTSTAIYKAVLLNNCSDTQEFLHQANIGS